MLRLDPKRSARFYALYTKGRVAQQESERLHETRMIAQLAKSKENEDRHFNADEAPQFADDICRKLLQDSKFRLRFTRDPTTGLRCIIGHEYHCHWVYGPYTTNVFATLDIIRKRYHYYKCRVFVAFDDQLAADFEFCDPYECAMMMAPILCRDVLGLVVRNLV